MKITICLSILLTAVMLISPAVGQISMGAIGGVTFSDFTLKNIGEGSDIAMRTAYTVGASINYTIHPNVQLSFEPLYLQKHARLNQAPSDPAIDISLTYLEVPLFVKAYFGGDIRPYVLAGPSLGILLSSEARSVFLGKQFSGSINNILQKTNLGLAFGGGISIPVGGSTFFLEGYYTFGLRDMSKKGSLAFTTDHIMLNTEIDGKAEIRSRGMQILTGLSVPLGR